MPYCVPPVGVLHTLASYTSTQTFPTRTITSAGSLPVHAVAAKSLARVWSAVSGGATPSAARSTGLSFFLQASRIFTVPERVSQRTAARAAGSVASRLTARRTVARVIAFPTSAGAPEPDAGVGEQGR